METALLTQADFVLNKCGRPVAPKIGLSSIYLPHGFLIQTLFPAATTSPTATVTKEITGDTVWCLRGIQITSTTATAISIQILRPDGTFLINYLQDVLQIAGYGSYKYTFTREERCQPGTKISITFNVTDTAQQQPIAICLDGAYQYLLKGGEGRICPVDESAGNLPRYFGHPNQNIMAPAWQHGVSPATPVGYRDEDFVYSALGPTSDTSPAGTPGSTISVTAANATTTQKIGMDSAEFHVTRVLIQITADDTVTAGSVLVRFRAGSGYAFTDDYLDAARYIGSCPYPVDWVIDPNDAVYADLLLVDQAGTGNVYWTMFLEGFKRRKA